ncbi:LacI family DNA-binding transcriptional regulator [Brevibacterium samyangense]|uniref:LacI family DNA-binding transcriptional regulator n=1 Tax=Brevibacterium samyangense TaxID=366888 RepID=A0ABN2T6B8_9MICO
MSGAPQGRGAQGARGDLGGTGDIRGDVSLRAIAEASGKSISTVSRVLRGKPGVSEEARTAVEVALRTLGVRSRQAPRAGTLIALVQAVVRGSDVDPYETLALEVAQRMFRRGWVAVRVATGEDLASSAARLAKAGVSGAIVLGGGTATPEAARLAAHGIPLIRVSNARHEGVAQIVLDSAQGIDTAVRHLVHLGHRRIGLATPEDSSASIRTGAFRKSIADVLHIPATRDQAPVVVGGTGIMSGSQAADQLLRERCTAIISCSPALTFGVLEAARRLGLGVPRDLSILSVGEMPDADVVDPPMSQVAYDWAAIAESVLEELARLVRGAGHPADYLVAPELVLRSSEKPVAQR